MRGRGVVGLWFWLMRRGEAVNVEQTGSASPLGRRRRGAVNEREGALLGSADAHTRSCRASSAVLSAFASACASANRKEMKMSTPSKDDL